MSIIARTLNEKGLKSNRIKKECKEEYQMNTRKRKWVAAAMSCILLAGAVLPYEAANMLAASKPKLSKTRVVIRKGKKAKVTLKKKSGATKIKWSIGNKKTASIKAKKATVTVTGKKAGNTKLTCRFRLRGKTKKLVCRVIVTSGTVTVPTEEPEETNPPQDSVQPPAGTGTPGSSSEPGQSQNPGNSERPYESSKPDVTNKPVGTDNPGTSDKPDGTSKPDETNKPIVTDGPGETQKPGTSEKPDVSEKPQATQKPGASEAPDKSEMPAVSEKPSVSPSPTPEPAKAGVLLDNDYSDGKTGGFVGRGSASVKPVTNESIAKIPVLSVTGRAASWNGAQLSESKQLEPGKTYMINTAVYQNAVASTEIYLTLFYKDSTGKDNYSRVATAAAAQNVWTDVQTELAVPEGATDLCLFFEEKATNDFYVAPMQILDGEQYSRTAMDNFENDLLTNFRARNATLETVEDGVMGKCLKVSGRTQAWNGVASAVSIKPGASVYVSAYVKTNAEGRRIKVSAQGKNAAGKDDYPELFSTKLTAGEWTKLQCVKTFAKEDYTSMDYVYFEIPDRENESGEYPDFYLDNVNICVVNPPADVSDLDADSTYEITGSLLESYQPFFGRVGTCINAAQLNGEDTFAFVKSQYNSITPENETKPDSMLNRGTMSVSDARNNKYYYVPENYTEDKCPNINYSQVDAYMKKAAENGIGIRFHVFVWHQQTPKWFFKENYDANGAWVDAETMNARLELYIKSVIRYITLKEEELGYGDVVYCYDVVNEYFNNDNNKDSSGNFEKASWEEVYYPEKTLNSDNKYVQTTEPVYVKNAFTYAREILDSYGKTNIPLFYNDFNTYMGDHPDNIIAMMKYINKEKTLCDGLGMQSHLDVSYPSPEGFASALKKFLDCDKINQVQITELDVTAYETKSATLEQQMEYYGKLMESVLALQKTYPDKLTGLTFWGLYDGVSWRKDGKPLLFASTTKAKGVYFKVLQAAAEAKGQ